MKRIISIVIILSLVLGLQVAYASDDNYVDYSYEIDVLSKIGVFDNIDYARYGANDYINYYDYMQMIKNIVCGSDAPYDLNGFSKSYGYIKETTTLSMSSYVTYDFAVKAAIKLLGYDRIAEVLDNNAYSYILRINRLGIAKGLSYKSGETIKFADAAKLIYNTINENVFEMNSVSTDKDRYVYNYKKSDETVMNRYMDIYEYEGVVTATPYTAMYGESTLSKNEVGIGEYTFASDNADIEDLVGVNVTAYYKDTDGRRDFIAAVPDDDIKYISVNAEDISSYDESVRRVDYFDENGKKRNLRLDSSAAVIYNNKGLSQYGKTEFEIDDGYIVFYDNDGNGSYDVANIKKYNYVLVDSVYKYGDDVTITNKITFDGYSKISADDEDKIVIKDIDGKDVEIKSIKRNDLLAVIYNSGAENKKIEIAVSNEFVSGKPDSLDGNYDDLSVNDTEYEFSGYYKNAMEKNEKYAPEIDITKEYTFYINTDGKIVAAKIPDKDDYLYGYLQRAAAVKKGISYECKIKVYTQEAEWETYLLNEKIRFNDFKGKIEDTKVISDYLGEGDETFSQMIAYRLDKDNKVTEIKTAVDEDATDDENAFTKSKTSGLAYRVGRISSFGTQYFAEAGASVFLIPNDNNEDNFSIVPVTSLIENQTYSVCGYNGDRFNCYEFFTVKHDYSDYQKTLSQRGAIFVIDDIVHTINSDGDEITRIYGITGFLTTFSMDMIPELKGNDLKCGDVIKFNKNTNGNIDYYEKVFDIDTMSCPTIDDNANVLYRNMSGTVTDVDYENGRIAVECNNNMSFVYTDASSKYVVYEKGGKSASTRSGSISDFEVDDIVYSSTNYGYSSNVYIVKK